MSNPELSNEQQDLTNAFQAFNQLSAQLADSYQALEQRVAGLSEELAASQTQRMLELQEKEKLALRLQSLINALPAAVIVLDGEGVIQEYNLVAAELLGHHLQLKTWNEVRDAVFDAQKSTANEIALKNDKWIVMSTCPLGSEPGQIILLNDITETKKLQEQLKQQERLVTMGETAASLAHQIRTPLASAILYASNLKRSQLNDGERIKFAEKIFERLHHLETVVNDMLLYAKGLTSELSLMNHHELVEELKKLIESHLTETSTILSWEDELEQPLEFSANRQMLISALINLIVNAIQAMGKNGKIVIRTQKDCDGMLVVKIIDSGPGIKNKDTSRIFEPFFTTRKEGTGLGLAVVKAIIQAHEGNIYLEDTNNEGTTFTINLPIINNLEESSYKFIA